MSGINAAFFDETHLRSFGFKALGSNVRIHQTAVLVDCAKISMGDNVRIDPFSVISVTGGVSIGNHVHIASHVVVTGGAAIDICDHVGLSHGVRVFSSSDDFSGEFLTGPTIPFELRSVSTAPIRIGRHVVLGAGSVVLPGADVGDGATIGALSLVNRALEEWTVFAGIPARRIRARSRNLLRLEAQLANR